jgi:Nucleotide modification associated domain 2
LTGVIEHHKGRDTMARIYFYKLTADNGGAPCVQGGLLSLAICKPMIRGTACIGDLIFGFAAKSLSEDNCLLYAARITGKLCDGEYYVDKRFTHREDCIYECRNGRFVWREGARHHGPMDLIHDLGQDPHYPKANVLLSRDFRYFGANGTDEYKSRFPRVKAAVKILGEGHRVRHREKLRSDLENLKEQLWRDFHNRVTGRPISEPQTNVCHRSRSCEVLLERSLK